MMKKSRHQTTSRQKENKLGLKVCLEPVGRGNEPFSTAERSERVENFFFVQLTKVQAAQNRPDQSRSAMRGAHHTNNYITSLPNLASSSVD